MKQKFDKDLLFENISFLIKEKDMKLGEFEKSAGVSPGYIARTRDGNSKPGIEFIMNAANSLNTSIDTLLTCRLSQLNSTEVYLIKFISKLNSDTRQNKLLWLLESKNYLNRLECDINGNVDHPLFSLETFFANRGSDYPEEVTEVVFTSNSYDVNTSINNDCFNLRLKNGAVLYVMNICKSEYRLDDVDAHAIELWMHLPNRKLRFLCSNRGNTLISQCIDILYDSLTEDSKHPKIYKDVLEAIDSYMDDDFEDDEVDDNFNIQF